MILSEDDINSPLVFLLMVDRSSSVPLASPGIERSSLAGPGAEPLTVPTSSLACPGTDLACPGTALAWLGTDLACPAAAFALLDHPCVGRGMTTAFGFANPDQSALGSPPVQASFP